MARALDSQFVRRPWLKSRSGHFLDLFSFVSSSNPWPRLSIANRLPPVSWGFQSCYAPFGSDLLRSMSRANFFFYYYFFYFIITLGIHLQYSYTVLTYNKTTKFTYVTALLLTCLLLTYIKIPKTSLQQTKGLLKTINK